MDGVLLLLASYVLVVYCTFNFLFQFCLVMSMSVKQKLDSTWNFIKVHALHHGHIDFCLIVSTLLYAFTTE